MADQAPRPWTLDPFFTWQDRQADRYELVGGFPLRMPDVPNLHGTIVVNCLTTLHGQLRGTPCRVFSGQGAIETLPGQIRRPDAGVDCGRRDPDGYKAAEPRLVAEVLFPNTRDYDVFEKLTEYKAVESLDHILYIDTDVPNVVHWARSEDRVWAWRNHVGTDASLVLADLGLTLALRDIYEDVILSVR